MTNLEIRQLEGAIRREEAEIEALEARLRRLRAKMQVRRDCRAIAIGQRLAQRGTTAP